MRLSGAGLRRPPTPVSAAYPVAKVCLQKTQVERAPGEAGEVE